MWLTGRNNKTLWTSTIDETIVMTTQKITACHTVLLEVIISHILITLVVRQLIMAQLQKTYLSKYNLNIAQVVRYLRINLNFTNTSHQDEFYQIFQKQNVVLKLIFPCVYYDSIDSDYKMFLMLFYGFKPGMRTTTRT